MLPIDTLIRSIILIIYVHGSKTIVQTVELEEVSKVLCLNAICSAWENQIASRRILS